MSKKFVRSEWMSPERFMGYSDVFLDLMQSIEDRLFSLEYTPIPLEQRFSGLLGEQESLKHEMNLHIAALQNRMQKMEDRMKSQQSLIETMNGSIYMLGTHLNELKDKLEAIGVEQHLNKFTIEQKKHICSAIDKWMKISFYQKENLVEELKCMICDTKIGEFLPDDN